MGGTVVSWIDAIELNQALVKNGQTDLAVIVSGSAVDSAFWARSAGDVACDTLREDGRVQIVGLAEEQPLGNFLGTVNAWRELKRRVTPAPSRGVALLNMVFGKGKRFSPFTQALGNRKAAFPTPARGQRSGAYLRTGDLATLYSNSWLDQLRARGFNGMLIKWGDEAVIPSLDWNPAERDFSDIDLVRFVWRTQPNDVLAREKEWLVIDEQSGLIERMIPRQDLASLRSVLQTYEGRRFSTAVNLGSVAVSYRFLELASGVFGEVLGGRAAADWDPFVMMMLLTDDAGEMSAAEARCPGIGARIKELRSRILHTLRRPLRAGFLDFGEAFWVDIGLHTTLRRCLDAMTEDDIKGRATRAFFGIPDERDANGNIIIGSELAPGARIKGSVIINSTIHDPASEVRGGVVVGSRHNRLTMCSGGASLFASVRELRFDGGNGIVFRSVGDAIVIPQGGRHTSLFLSETPITLQSNENIRAYDDAEYSRPISGNRFSFEEAGNLAGALDPGELEANWRAAWQR